MDTFYTQHTYILFVLFRHLKNIAVILQNTVIQYFVTTTKEQIFIDMWS